MKIISVGLIPLLLTTIAVSSIAQAAPPGPGKASKPNDGLVPHAIPVAFHNEGVVYDAGGVWVTDFMLNGAILTVPHDPALGNLVFVTTVNGSWIVNLDTATGGGDDDWGLPATAGSGACWAIPYGPPNPDGTWPTQLIFTKITGHGDNLYAAVADYKAKFGDALSEGAFPSPGSCD